MCSKQAVFDGKKAIRGGIPFVFREYIFFFWRVLTASIFLSFFLLTEMLLSIPSWLAMMDDDRPSLSFFFSYIAPLISLCVRLHSDITWKETVRQRCQPNGLLLKFDLICSSIRCVELWSSARVRQSGTVAHWEAAREAARYGRCRSHLLPVWWCRNPFHVELPVGLYF